MLSKLIVGFYWSIFRFFAVKIMNMIAAADFNITPIERSKLHDINLENIPFGKHFTDHMLVADFENGEWKTPEIKPYQALSIEPSMASIHYGQSIFEGVKAYKDSEGKPYIFRPYDNFKRFNISAKRMQMPEVPEEIFIEGMKKLIQMDQNWIPSKDEHSLYIRPFMFSTDEAIGVKPGEKYKFMIILSPTGPYYSEPMRIYVEEQYVRAVPGGVGFAKNAGNYGAAMYASAEARKKGYDQVLWTDAFEHRYIEECGTMNVFFVIGKKAITPSLEQGTILAGVTRDSVIKLLTDMEIEVEERRITIDEVSEAYSNGELKEVFGTGTAATISLIKELRYKETAMQLDTEKWTIAPEIKKQLQDIRFGRIADNHNWMMPV
jgi:branched-chain amino acid aminotransferase